MDNRDPAVAAARPTAIAAAPVLNSVVPNSGPTAGNNVVTLNGSGFTGVTAVSFGTAAALLYTVNSTTQITATVPPGTGTVGVTVRTPGGTSGSVPYTYVAPPTLTAASPTQGPTSGGTTVVLTGTALTGATAVTFGGIPATSYIVNSATQITAVSPAGSGAVPITVTTAGGTSGPVYFFYVSAPYLVDISPGQGPASGGTTVVLTGAGLTGATAVAFGATPAASFTVTSSAQITAVSPAGTGSVAVTVTGPGGVSNPLTYTYVAPPVLSALSPAQGPTSAGAGVTLIGSGLTTTTAVRFGTASAAFTVLSDTTIAALAPAGTTGSVSVNVTSAGGTSNSLTYTRVAAPMI
ncbi:IPT/TIG domain-containing protein [Streptomyces sp. NPDC059396]|uniref:IPT/TIG domain-containing protein n=1 Tax=Streptomyces sp. NPDC059396 TaxID=3346819 RepID=UPI0036A34152